LKRSKKDSVNPATNMKGKEISDEKTSCRETHQSRSTHTTRSSKWKMAPRSRGEIVGNARHLCGVKRNMLTIWHESGEKKGGQEKRKAKAKPPKHHGLTSIGKTNHKKSQKWRNQKTTQSQSTRCKQRKTRKTSKNDGRILKNYKDARGMVQKMQTRK